MIVIIRLGRRGAGGVYLADENPLAEDGDGFFDGAEGAGRVHGGVGILFCGFHWRSLCVVCEFLHDLKRERERVVINVI